MNNPFINTLSLNDKMEICFVSDTFVSNFGVDQNELMGQHLEDFFSRKEKKGEKRYFNILSQYDGGLVDLILLFNFGDEEYFCRLLMQKANDDTWNIVLEDIIHKDNTLLELRLNKERWSTIMSNSIEGIGILGPDNSIESFNSRFFELCGFTAENGISLNEEAITGRDFFSLLIGEEFQPLQDIIEKSQTKKNKKYDETHHYNELYLNICSNPIHIPAKGFSGSCIVIKDVTSHKLLEETTANLTRRNQDIDSMLGNIKQGLFSITQDLTIHSEYSMHLEEILETSDIAGKHYVDVIFANCSLGSNALDQINALLSCSIGGDSFSYECNSHVLETNFDITINGIVKSLELEWNPIIHGDDVERILVTVRDITELLKLRSEAKKNENELLIIAEVLNYPEQKIFGFINNAFELLKDTSAILDANTLSSKDISKMFRNIHTIKGNARTYGLKTSLDLIHNEEDTYSYYRNNPNTPIDKSKLQNGLENISKMIKQYQYILCEKLGKTPTNNTSDHILSDEKINLLESILDSNACNDADKIEVLKAEIHSFRYRDVIGVFNDLKDSIPSISAELHTAEPDLEFDISQLYIRKEHISTIENIFSHLVKNSIDHGRTADHPAIDIKIRVKKEWVSFQVHDNGEGLDIGKIKSRGVALHLIDEDSTNYDEITHLIFDPGFSTKPTVSNISGRGVGMSAVEEFCGKLGGSIDLELDESHFDHGMMPFIANVQLPRSLFS